MAGAAIAVRAGGATTQPFSLGTVRVHVAPALHGRVDAYVPLTDWGVRLDPFRAPVAIHLELRAVDRQTLLRLLDRRRGGYDLATTKRELDGIVVHALRRAALLALLGGVAGGLFAAALIASGTGARRPRRRWLLAGPALGGLVVAAVVGLSAADIARSEAQATDEPTFYAHGGELPHLLRYAEELRTSRDHYIDSYHEALAGVRALTRRLGTRIPPPPSSSSKRVVIVASDLHNNELALSAFAPYAKGKTTFLVGDLTQRGTKVEARLARRVARLGLVVAVSGNHDSPVVMRALARAGAVVLTRTGRLRANGKTAGPAVVDVDGYSVAGFDDPLEGSSLRRAHLSLGPAELARAKQRLVGWFDALPRRPQIVLVHEHALAHALFDHVEARGGAPLLILTGHDHRQHLHEGRTAIMVDGGTLGAGGAFHLGTESAGFVQLEMAYDGQPSTAELVDVEPLSGDATARRIVLDGPAASPPHDASGRSPGTSRPRLSR